MADITLANPVNASLGTLATGYNRCELCDEAFHIFACMWGQVQMLRLCTLLCRSNLTLLEWLSSTGCGASTMLLSSIMCILVPDEATMAAAICSSLAATWAAMPSDVDGCAVYELLVQINLLAGLAWSLLTGKAACEGWISSGPAIRCIFVLFFLVNAFSRLNCDFHNVRKSSSSALMIQFADKLGTSLGIRRSAVDKVGDMSWLRILRFCMYTMSALSIAVPALMWTGYVRAGLCIAWLFCMTLTLTPAFDFALVLVSTMACWVQPQSLTALRWMTLSSTSRMVSFSTSVCLLGPMLVQPAKPMGNTVSAAALWVFLANPLAYATQNANVESWVFPASSAKMCATEVAQQTLAAPAGFVSFVGCVTIGLALLNGVAPYLGLKTQGTWTLFSNLHVENGSTNHYLVPASFQLFGYTLDCVTVTKSNAPMLLDQHAVIGGSSRLGLFGQLAERESIEASIHCSTIMCSDSDDDRTVCLPYKLPYFELRRIISTQAVPMMQDFFVEYSHWGAPHRFEVQDGIPVGCSDPKLMEVPSGFLSKFIAFSSRPAHAMRDGAPEIGARDSIGLPHVD